MTETQSVDPDPVAVGSSVPDAVDVADRIRSGETRAEDVVGAALQRIAETQDELGAFVFVDRDSALASARAVDDAVSRGEDPGMLAGVPFGVKELQLVLGWPWTLATYGHQNRTATVTSSMIARMVAAGAVPVGLTASPPLGRSSCTTSDVHGVTRNPWDTSLTPGGSSGGSAAAVASGVLPLCTGTDGAGSLRIPASFSGLVGFKGTRGRVTRGPIFSGAMGNDCYGVLTRSVRDTARFLDCVVGVDERDPDALPAPDVLFETVLDRAMQHRGLRIVWSDSLGYAACDPAVSACVRQTVDAMVDGLGLIEVEREVSLFDCSDAFRLLSTPDVYQAVRGFNAADVALLPASVRQYLNQNHAMSLHDLVSANEKRHTLVEAVADVFDETDLVVTPATQTTAFPAEGPMPRTIAGTEVSHWGSIGLTFAFNLTGHPAISVPAGLVDGLPVGLQIVAPRHHDWLLLTIAAAFEQLQPWPGVAPAYAGDTSAAVIRDGSR